MKALVMAGHSSRGLSPFSPARPSQLVPIANKPLLFYALKEIADAGITDVGVITGENAAEVHRVLDNGSRFGLNLTYVHQEFRRGLVHSVVAARSFLDDDDFLFHPGHAVVVDALPRLVKEYRELRPEALAMVGSDAGIGRLETDGQGRGVRVLETTRNTAGRAMTGVYVFSPAIHEAIANIRPTWRKTLEVIDALRWLADRGYTVRAHEDQGFCGDASGPDSMLACNRHVLSTVRTEILGSVDEGSSLTGPVVVEYGAEVTRCHITGPVVIGHDTVLSDSVIGPDTAIGADCVVRDAELGASVLLDGAWVGGVRGVRDSVIGRDARVGPRPEAAGTHRLLIGDRAHVHIGA
ncbi:sugar phosphate nucleotidyltransferase [Streptomyces acidicola]|uniref:sugar phosphate nucleotidyltransferase n=1 Tax=Streptomyces acidicola TaxID=2596892 RepID=UPI0037F20D55